jgi:hypothetical protein
MMSYSHLICSLIVKEKKWHFCLRNLYREFPCDISIHICIRTWIGSSPIFFPFYFSPLLMLISICLKILYSFLYKKYINHIHFLNFLILPSLSFMWTLLSVTCLS